MADVVINDILKVKTRENYTPLRYQFYLCSIPTVHPTNPTSTLFDDKWSRYWEVFASKGYCNVTYINPKRKRQCKTKNLHEISKLNKTITCILHVLQLCSKYLYKLDPLYNKIYRNNIHEVHSQCGVPLVNRAINYH